MGRPRPFLQELAPARPFRAVEQVLDFGQRVLVLGVQRKARLDQPAGLLDAQGDARRHETRELSRSRLRLRAREYDAGAARALVSLALLHAQLLETKG